MADQEDQQDGNQPMAVDEQGDGSALVSLDEDPEMEEQEDGSVVVNLGKFKGPEENEDFYSNLVQKLDRLELASIALQYCDLIDKDMEDRKSRDDKYAEGIKRTGMSDDAPGGAHFLGASRVVHPVMAEGCVDFAARAIKELFPPDGPVRTKIVGEMTEEKEETANRKRDFNNWQLTEQIEEFRDEQEQLLTQLPLGGSQYMLMTFDSQLKRPTAEFVPVDNVVLPFAAANFYTSQRATHMQDITSAEFERRVKIGLYESDYTFAPSSEPESTAAGKASDKVEGRSFHENVDGIRRVYHIYTWLELEGDPLTGGDRAPYIMMVDETEHRMLGLYRNWEDGDATMKKLDWMVEFKFVPWRGAYAVGLPHLIGGLSGAATGALRALLDSAHINNSATLLKLKGGKISGQTDTVEISQVVEIEGAPGIDDIRKLAMPMPFNPPSPILLQLLGVLVDSAKGVITTSEEKIADATSQMPVGTTQALIEQGAAVFSAIHARLHASQKRVLAILNRLNRWYLDDMERGDIVADLPVSKKDFLRNGDVIPVSDPHIFSETQRVAQNQSVLQLATQFPDLFDRRQVVFRVLNQLKIPNVNELMPNTAKPTEQNSADENIAMALGHLAFAYPGQDHIAHLHVHIEFALNPMFGANPLLSQALLPACLEHIKQHMTLWYRERIHHYGGKGVNLDKYGTEKRLVHTIDDLMVKAQQHVMLDAQQVFPAIMQGIQQMQQLQQQLAQQKPQPQDPVAQATLQASMAETQRRAARDKQDGQLAAQKMTLEQQEMAQRMQMELDQKQKDRQVTVAMNAEDNLTKERIAAAKVYADQTSDQAALEHQQQKTALELQQKAQSELGGI